ncbi:MAG: helix-turn-helix domain-containing protein [Roseiarcus sp.]
MEAQKAIENLGETFRRVRLVAGLTLEAVARQADVTKGYLSKVESGRALPSIAVISKLADVYGMPLSDIFMPEGQRKPLALVRANERTPMNKNGSELGYIYEFASMMKRNPRAEVFFLTLPVLDGEVPPRFKHSGEEIITVLEGRMLFEYGGMEFEMGPGDCIQFESDIEHHGVAVGSQPAKLFVVTIPDRSERKKKP